MDQDQTRASSFRFVFFATILLFSALGLFAARYAFPLFQKNRADRYAAEAQAHLDRKDFPEAQRRLQDALNFRPHDPRYLRLGARIYAAQRDPAAFPYYQALLRLPNAAEQDRFALVEFALTINRIDVAEKALRPLLAQKPSPARVDFYDALIAEEQRDFERAIRSVRSAVAKDPEQGDYKYLLGRFLFTSKQAEQKAEGKQILLEVAERADVTRLAAIRLVASAELTPRELERLLKALRETNSPFASDSLLASELLLRRSPENRQQIAATAFKRFKNGSPEDRIALGTWLNRHGLFDQTMTIYSEKDLTNRALTVVYLDALAGAHKWQEAYNFLSKTNLPLERAQVEAFRSAAARNIAHGSAPLAETGAK